jgi:hypothetical protein
MKKFTTLLIVLLALFLAATATTRAQAFIYQGSFTQKSLADGASRTFPSYVVFGDREQTSTRTYQITQVFIYLHQKGNIRSYSVSSSTSYLDVDSQRIHGADFESISSHYAGDTTGVADSSFQLWTGLDSAPGFALPPTLKYLAIIDLANADQVGLFDVSRFSGTYKLQTSLTKASQVANEDVAGAVNRVTAHLKQLGYQAAN